jgi:hypothetical protein
MILGYMLLSRTPSGLTVVFRVRLDVATFYSLHVPCLTQILEVTECDQTESDKSRHYALLESDKTLFGMR